MYVYSGEFHHWLLFLHTTLGVCLYLFHVLSDLLMALSSQIPAFTLKSATLFPIQIMANTTKRRLVIYKSYSLSYHLNSFSYRNIVRQSLVVLDHVVILTLQHCGWISPCCFWLRGQCCSVPCLLYHSAARPSSGLRSHEWLNWIGWQWRPPGTNSSLCREVKNTVLLLWNLLTQWIQLWPVSDLWCLYAACAENTNVQWAKHEEGEVLSVSVSWWNKQIVAQVSPTSAFWWLVASLCHCMKMFYKGWHWI